MVRKTAQLYRQQTHITDIEQLCIGIVNGTHVGYNTLNYSGDRVCNCVGSQYYGVHRSGNVE